MYCIERVNKENLKNLVFLFKAAFNKSISIDFLNKKLNHEISGVKFLGLLSFTKSHSPAAYYGVLPIVISHNNEKILTAQSGDTMTHSDHQGKGLFIELASLTYELAKENKINLVWGFPNKNSYKGFTTKLNWVDNGPLTKFKIKVGTLPVAKSLTVIKSDAFNMIHHRLCKLVFGSKLKAFIKTEEEGHPFVLKDQAFFDYKNYIPNRLIIGDENNKIWAKVEGSLQIGDIHCTSEKEFIKLINSLKSKCRLLGITDIVFICNTINPYYNLFKNLEGVTLEDSLSFCYLPGWNDELAKSMSICMADFDTF